MNKLNCFVAQSGGPTVAINSSLAGVVKGVAESEEFGTIYGAVNGIMGILDNRMLNLSDIIMSGDNNKLMCLKHTPAMYLGSCRYKLKDYHDDDSDYKRIFSQFERYNIGAFFYIGGNDSMDTVLKLSEYARLINSDVKIIGIPKTVDNDLMITDHTPGFGSAAKYVATTLLEVAHDTFIYAVKSITIVEIMGRDAGWLTAASALARNTYNTAPHFIYLPEVPFDKDQFIEDAREFLKDKNNLIVAISEGIRDKEGNYISAGESAADTFGHKQLSGAGQALSELVKERLGVKVRSVEINVLQRSAAHSASQTDLDEAFKSGEKAVRLAEQGITGAMVIMKRTDNAPYTIAYDYAEIKGIANEAKSVPVDWINERGNDVTKKLVDYIQPLILGEVSLNYENGVPIYMDVPHLKAGSIPPEKRDAK